MIVSPLESDRDYNGGLVAWSVALYSAAYLGGSYFYGTLHLSQQFVQAGLTPILKPLPYALRFQSEPCADRHEGEKLVRVIAKKPFLSLMRRLGLDTSRPNLKLLLKTKESIVEHCVQQRRLRAHSGEADLGVKKVLWERPDVG